MSKAEELADFRELHIDVLEEVQREWASDTTYYKGFRLNERGVRSSQLAAFIAVLIKKGIITRAFFD